MLKGANLWTEDLSDQFYVDYPADKYPELEQKNNRPYIQVCVRIGGVQFAIPLRSDIHHPHVLWTDKENKCGVDFSKAVVITDEKYIDLARSPYLRQKEFNALRGKDYRIKQKMKKYIEQYKKAKKDQTKSVNIVLCKFSTLQYFEEYLEMDKT